MRVVVPLVAVLLLLAGCAEPGAAPDDAAGGDQAPDGTAGDAPPFAPQQGHDRATHDDVVVEGDMATCEAGFCIDAEARNEGDRTYHVSSICVSPWSDRMERDGQRVQHVEPMAHCLAWGTSPFAPGDSLEVALAWNATLWNETRQQAEPAPPGAYEWIVSFRFYGGADGEGTHALDLSFTVVVGQT